MRQSRECARAYILLFIALMAATTAPRAEVTNSAKTDPNELSGSITVWSWNIAAEALSNLVPAFNRRYPRVKVNVINMGHSDVRHRALAACTAGGRDLPDVVTIENMAAEQFWMQFPNCFMDLNKLGFQSIGAEFPAFQKIGLSAGGKAYAMPWDSGPSAVFYRRDLFKAAGIDSGSIHTWDDFIAAGKKMRMATKGQVAMIQDDKDEDVLFRQLAVQNGCSYFSNDGASVTISQPGCVEALQIIKKMWDAGIVSYASWDEKIRSFKASRTATQVYGGWYAGTISSNAPEQAGKWGVFRLPAFKPGSRRASNTGGSSLAISARSKNAQAAYAFISYALATREGQVSMLKHRGLVPALLAAMEDPYIWTPQSYWGGQAIWAELLGTLADVPSYRTTRYHFEAMSISAVTISNYIDDTYPSAAVALKTAADQIAAATGLPVAE